MIKTEEQIKLDYIKTLLEEHGLEYVDTATGGLMIKDWYSINGTKETQGFDYTWVDVPLKLSKLKTWLGY